MRRPVCRAQCPIRNRVADAERRLPFEAGSVQLVLVQLLTEGRPEIANASCALRRVAEIWEKVLQRLLIGLFGLSLPLILQRIECCARGKRPRRRPIAQDILSALSEGELIARRILQSIERARVARRAVQPEQIAELSRTRICAREVIAERSLSRRIVRGKIRTALLNERDSVKIGIVIGRRERMLRAVRRLPIERRESSYFSLLPISDSEIRQLFDRRQNPFRRKSRRHASRQRAQHACFQD